MLNKVTNPMIFREGKTQNIQFNNWFTTNKKQYVRSITNTVLIRGVVTKFYAEKQVIFNRMFIDIQDKKILIHIFAFNPSKIIGPKGQLIADLVAKFKKHSINPYIKVVKTGKITASFVSQNIATSLEKRSPTNSVLKFWNKKLGTDNNILGYKIVISGRLNGAEKKKQIKIQNGILPLQTLDAQIDYHLTTSFTNTGTIGCKVTLHVKSHLLNSESSNILKTVPITENTV